MVKPTSFFADFPISDRATDGSDTPASMRANDDTQHSSEFQKTLMTLAKNDAAITELTCPEGLRHTEILALAKAIRKNISLVSLDMGGNMLDENASKAFYKAMKKNNYITSFAATPIEGDAKAVNWLEKIEGEVQKNEAQEFPPIISKKLREKRDANIERKEREDEESRRPHTIQSAITSFSENTYPSAHLICPTGMTQKQLQSLAEALTQNESLTSLDIGHNVMNAETLVIMRDAMMLNHNLTDISWGAESVTQGDGMEALREDITSLVQHNAEEAKTYAHALLDLRSLFRLSDTDITNTFDAINERTSAISFTLRKITTQISVIKDPNEVFETANTWGSARYIHTRLDAPQPLVAPLDDLTIEPALRPVPTSQVQSKTAALDAPSFSTEASTSRVRT